MAVLVEAISVIVLRGRIDAQYPDGWDGFVRDCPNTTLCADAELARVGFMTPVDARAFCERLEAQGLCFHRDGRAVDFAVVDQLRGPMLQCDWLQCMHVEIGGSRVVACRLDESHVNEVAIPIGWTYEGSISAEPGFVPTKEIGSTLVLLRHEGGLDVFLDRSTGKEVFMGRTSTGAIDGLEPGDHRGKS